MLGGVDLRAFNTLRAGGRAQRLAVARTSDEFVELFLEAGRNGWQLTILGHGSNVLPSDAGVPGLVLVNRAAKIAFGDGGEVTADAGCPLQDVFIETAQRGLAGLQFAVGIPGTLGGALVSNAGAYRSCISDLVTAVEIVHEGCRRWVEPDWMEFSYRNSVLRGAHPPRCGLVSVRMRMPRGDRKAIYDEAREYQRQRIGKQPPSASAGSFFKNVEDSALAHGLAGLPGPLKRAGVVPAGYLLEGAGLKGARHGGAMFSRRHANFIVNVGGATATDIASLAGRAKEAVRDQFGVTLEEEVLMIGDWDTEGRGG